MCKPWYLRCFAASVIKAATIFRMIALDKKIIEFKDRMRELVSWQKAEWPYEYQFWKEHRGLK